MSGVIDKAGVQWERCNECGAFTRISSLWYEERSSKYTCGRDLCSNCVEKLGNPVNYERHITYPRETQS